MFKWLGISNNEQTVSNMTKVIENYKSTHSLEHRTSYKVAVANEKKKNPDAPEVFPVIVISLDPSLKLKKQKFLFAPDVPFYTVTSTVNDRLKKENLIVDASQTVTCFVNGKHLPNGDQPINQLKEHRDPEDNNLYIVYTKENAYGAI